MNVSINNGPERLWSNRSDISAEEAALKILVDSCFVHARKWGAWLIYFKKNGQGLSLAVGPIRPQRKKIKRSYRHIDVAAVDEKFQPLLLAEGPSALQWNGHAVVARGH